MRIANRMSRVKASGVRAFFEKGRSIRDAIDLSIGQADFDVPAPVKEATARALRTPCGKYSPTQGFPDLVAATTEHLREGYGLPEGDEVMMTSGATGAINLGLLALVDPGDEVLLPDPGFVMYRTLVEILGGVPVAYDMHPDFRLRVEEVEKGLSDRTRLVILNSPSNPTGAAAGADEVGALATLCAERGVPVLSDELYALFRYDDPHVSIKRFPACESLLVGGFSKAFGMAGWRLGWAAGPPELIEPMRTLQQFSYTCPPTLVQRGAMAAFDVDMSAEIEAYRRKRDLVHDGLVAAGYETVKPGGTFFFFPRVPWGDDLEFCNRALEEKLILVPGRTFGSSTQHFRLSFAASDETLERGLEVLDRLARS